MIEYELDEDEFLKVERLIALAIDSSTTVEERRSAAIQACRLIQAGELLIRWRKMVKATIKLVALLKKMGIKI